MAVSTHPPPPPPPDPRPLHPFADDAGVHAPAALAMLLSERHAGGTPCPDIFPAVLHQSVSPLPGILREIRAVTLSIVDHLPVGGRPWNGKKLMQGLTVPFRMPAETELAPRMSRVAQLVRSGRYDAELLPTGVAGALAHALTAITDAGGDTAATFLATMDAIHSVLDRAARQAARLPDEDVEAAIKAEFDECHGAHTLEQLQYSANEEIYAAAAQILATFFDP